MNTPVTERVKKLRTAYLNAPMVSKQLGYKYLRNNESFSIFGFCLQKQRLLFTDGWIKNKTAYSTRLRRAGATAYVLENMPVVIDDYELIVGKPDLSALSEDEQNKLAQHERSMDDFAPNYFGRVDHCSLDFEKLLRIGVKGLIDEIEGYKKSLAVDTPEDIRKNDFYEGCLIELEALCKLQQKYAEYAASLAESTDGARKKELEEIAKILKRVPYYPAESFKEALQSIHFYSFNLWGLYLLGRPDQYLLPYYRKDIGSGSLTKAEAQELIDCFCLLYSTYVVTSSSIGFMVGGRDRQGNAVENELTKAFILSAGHTRTAYPSIGLAVHEETSEELIKLSLEQISEGCSHPAFFNDQSITAALQKHNIREEDAHDYIHSACVEITPCARSGIWVVSPYINLLSVLLDTLKSNIDFEDLDAVIRAFQCRLNAHVENGIAEQNRFQLERSRNGAEPLRASCLIFDCLKSGKSRCEGGAVYNHISPAFIGMFNVVESLITLESLVFGTKQYTIDELNEIMENDYKGNERLRSRIINQLVHFGNNEEFSDALAKRIASIVAESCKGIKTFFCDTIMPAAFSYNQHEIFGSETGASPDGRRAGYPLADGSGPVQGRDVQGPTLSILSSTNWDQSPYTGGIAINMKFTKKQFQMDNIFPLIKTFMQRGGLEIQFTVVDAETLRKARQYPEFYKDLSVRIGGYSDYFVNLPSALQEELIDRTEQVF